MHLLNANNPLFVLTILGNEFLCLLLTYLCLLSSGFVLRIGLISAIHATLPCARFWLIVNVVIRSLSIPNLLLLWATIRSYVDIFSTRFLLEIFIDISCLSDLSQISGFPFPLNLPFSVSVGAVYSNRHSELSLVDSFSIITIDSPLSALATLKSNYQNTK